MRWTPLEIVYEQHGVLRYGYRFRCHLEVLKSEKKSSQNLKGKGLGKKVVMLFRSQKEILQNNVWHAKVNILTYDESNPVLLK